MNTYKITFTRENGTVGSDNFTAPSEAQARRDFKEVYQEQPPRRRRPRRHFPPPLENGC